MNTRNNIYAELAAELARQEQEIARLREAVARARGRVLGVIRGDGVGLAYEAFDILSAALAATAPEGGTK